MEVARRQGGCLWMSLMLLTALFTGGILAIQEPPAQSNVYELEMAHCQAGHTAGIRPGQTVRIIQGVYRAPTLEEAQTVAQGSYPISADGVTLPTYFSEIVYAEASVNPLGIQIPPGYDVQVFADWIATSGQHTINAFNYEEGFTCTFTVEP